MRVALQIGQWESVAIVNDDDALLCDRACQHFEYIALRRLFGNWFVSSHDIQPRCRLYGKTLNTWPLIRCIDCLNAENRQRNRGWFWIGFDANVAKVQVLPHVD